MSIFLDKNKEASVSHFALSIIFVLIVVLFSFFLLQRNSNVVERDYYGSKNVLIAT